MTADPNDSTSSYMEEEINREQLLAALLQESILLTEDEDFSKERLKQVMNLWSTQDELLQREDDSTMRTVTVDLEAFTQTSGYVTKATKELKATDSTFDIVKLGNFIGSDHSSKHYEILHKAIPLMRGFTGFVPLLGTFNADDLTTNLPEAKKRKRRLEKDVLEEKEKPKEIENKDDNDLAIYDKIREVIKCLRKAYKENGNRPISYYKFILHPKCFATSVENLYCTSFLIKDCVAEIELIDGQLKISPITEDKQTTAGTGERITKNQVVMSLTVDQWERYVRLFEIASPMISD